MGWSQGCVSDTRYHFGDVVIDLRDLGPFLTVSTGDVDGQGPMSTAWPFADEV
jgi:hypothetical protein